MTENEKCIYKIGFKDALVRLYEVRGVAERAPNLVKFSEEKSEEGIKMLEGKGL